MSEPTLFDSGVELVRVTENLSLPSPDVVTASKAIPMPQCCAHEDGWEEERFYRAVLSCVVDSGSPVLSMLMEQFSAPLLCELICHRDPRVPPSWSRRMESLEIEDQLRRASDVGARFVIPGDQAWPSQLGDLDHVDPYHRVHGSPVGLWVLGNVDALTCHQAVSIVGARANSNYGEVVTREIAADLASPVRVDLCDSIEINRPCSSVADRDERTGGADLIVDDEGSDSHRLQGSDVRAGWTIVSGGAFGIDSYAHRGALNVDGVTIAVMASGLDDLYPRAHQQLFEEVTDRGALISEYPCGRRPTRASFLVRNRLVAALSQGTIVVEAAARSGAKNTAAWAQILSRFVGAVPGSVYAPTSQTPNWMIRDREAELVTCANDVRAFMEPVTRNLNLPREGAVRWIDQLPADHKLVYDAIPGRGRVNLDEICLVSGLDVRKVSAIMAKLNEDGRVTSHHDGSWSLVRR